MLLTVYHLSLTTYYLSLTTYDLNYAFYFFLCQVNLLFGSKKWAVSKSFFHDFEAAPSFLILRLSDRALAVDRKVN